jgi:hypothetical protein
MPKAPAAVKSRLAGSKSQAKKPAGGKRSGGRKPAAAKGKKDSAGKRTPATKRDPVVKLGYVDPNGISPSLYVLPERGAHRRPKIAKGMQGVVELRFNEGFAPVRMEFGDKHVLVEDAHEERPSPNPDLVIQGSLPDIVQLAAAPLVGGVPKVTHSRGRAALARVAGRRVKIEGSPLLARRLLKLLEI